jgi:hypothetical protein
MNDGNLRFVRTALALNATVNGLAGIALLVAPTWFFTYLGDFPPFNQHYMGDTGAFVLPLSMGLLFAMRRPHHHRLWIGLVALSGLLHTTNHFYDDWLHGWDLGHLLGSTLPLLLLTLLLVVAWLQLMTAKVHNVDVQ